jgi:hypothetical protein
MIPIRLAVVALTVAVLGVRAAAPAHADPNGFTLALDCDVSAAGVQSSCVLPNGQSTVDVAWVLTKVGGFSLGLGAFGLNAHDPDTLRLDPPAMPDPPLQYDSNPDFDQLDVTGGPWNCDIVPPDNDTGEDGPGKAVSSITCFPTGPTPTIPDGSKVLATVHYNVLRSQHGGTVVVTPQAIVGDSTGGYYMIDCLVPPVNDPQGTCVSTNIKVPCFIAVADVTHSGSVNVVDLYAIAVRANIVPVDPQYDPNLDGSINVIDLFLVAQQNGHTTAECLP